MGVGLNHEQFIIKGMTCGMGLHLVLNISTFVCMQTQTILRNT